MACHVCSLRCRVFVCHAVDTASLATWYLFGKLFCVATLFDFGEKRCRKNLPLCEPMANHNPYQSPETEAATSSKSLSVFQHRRCPNCRAGVHWTRFWLCAWIWAKWPCSGCGMLLTFDRRRRMLATFCVGVTTAICFAALFYFGIRPSSAIQAGLFGGACGLLSLPMMLIDGLALADS